MINDIYCEKQECTGCSACENSCPQKCIRMVPDGEGFLYPAINKILCTGCGMCGIVCPKYNVPYVGGHNMEAFLCRIRDGIAPDQSSPDEALMLFGTQTIADGGVFFGKRFDEDLRPVYGFAETPEELGTFKGCVHVQDTDETMYRQAEEFLSSGRKVLFDGPPCRIAGLMNYLHDDYEQLICIDHACSGETSSLVFHEYAQWLYKKYGSHVHSISFSAQGSGSVSVELKNGESFVKKIENDSMLEGLSAGLFLRPSCYCCPVKNHQSGSDLTLAECIWKGEIKKRFGSEKGVFLLLVNTAKGAAFLSRFQDVLDCIPVDIRDTGRYNCFLERSPASGKSRSSFFGKVGDTDFELLVADLTEPSNKEKVILGLQHMPDSLGEAVKKTAEKAPEIIRLLRRLNASYLHKR